MYFYSVLCRLQALKNAYIEANLKYATKKPFLGIIVSSQLPQFLATQLPGSNNLCWPGNKQCHVYQMPKITSSTLQ